MTLPLMLALLAGPAQALSTFPAEIETDLGMPCAPTCDLCHSSASGGGTPTQPFGLAMMDRGLSSSADSIAPALDEMVADAVDSDGDGTIDTEDLALGENPNPDGSPFCAAGIEGPSYGCLNVAPASAGLLGLLLGTGLVARRRR